MSTPAKDLTAKEKEAIRKLKALARSWPDRLWLFSASGTLHVMVKDNRSGVRAVCDGGGIDPDYAVANIRIENDGGDW